MSEQLTGMAAGSSEGPLKGRRAFVTGAGQGVGRGIAMALAEHGASLALMGRTASKVQAVADELKQAGASAIAFGGDVTSPADLERCVAATVDAFGGLDILVNNAQQYALGSLLDVTDEQIQSCWESGPLASFRLMKLCYPYLRGGGVVVNVGSSTSVNPTPTGRGVYGAVKAATQTLSRVAATEWGPDGVRVVNILPAATSPAAETWRVAQPEQYAQSMTSIPARRLGDPLADIGRAVAFVCGPDAGYITGTTLTLDGGQAYLR